MGSLWIFASLGPPLLLIGYGVFKARESWFSRGLWCGLLAGICAASLAVPVETVIAGQLGITLAAETTNPIIAAADGFLVAAIPEEALKLFALLVAMTAVDGRRLRSVLLVSIAVAMGFAGVENVLYLFKAGAQWQTVALLRGGASVPIHGVCGLMMGALVVGTIANDVGRLFGLIIALLVPVALHGTFDSLLMLGGWQFAAWRTQAVVFAMLVGGGLAVLLCNTALEAAAGADNEPEVGDALGGFSRWALKRAGRFYLGVLFVPAALGGFRSEAMWNATFLAVLPVVLGLDALISRVRHRPDATGLRPKQRSPKLPPKIPAV